MTVILNFITISLQFYTLVFLELNIYLYTQGCNSGLAIKKIECNAITVYIVLGLP